MIVFLLSLWNNPIVRKIIITVVVFVVIYSVYTVWLKKHDDFIRQQGRDEMKISLEKTEKERWKKVQDQIIQDQKNLKEQNQQLEIKSKLLDTKIAEDIKHRQKVDEVYNQLLFLSKLEKDKINADIKNIPANELINSIRLQSAKLPSSIRR